VSALGEQFLVVSSHENPHEIRTIKGARVRGSDGAVLDPSPMIVGPSFSVWPRAAALGGRWLVTWQQFPNHDNPRSNIYANFVTAAGFPGSSFAVHTDAISPSKKPDLAVAGDVALIVWGDSRTQPEFDDIYGRRITADGSFLDQGGGVPVVTAANEQYEPFVAWDGSRYALVHGDSRQDGPSDQHPGDIYGTLLDSSAQPLDPDGFAVFNAAVPEIHPGIAAASGTAVLAASVFHRERPFGTYRVTLRVLDQPTSSTEITGSASETAVRVTPNPSYGPVSLRFDLPPGRQAEAVLYHPQGRVLRRLGRFEGGSTAEMLWDGLDSHGRPLPSGVYVLRLEGEDVAVSAKVLRR
jgi:hypothetical protein